MSREDNRVITESERNEFQMEQVEQAPSRRHFPKGRITLLITGIISLIFSLALIHDYSVYQSYVQGSCVITSASVITETHSKSPTTYSPSYDFTVYTAGGQTYASHDSPGQYNSYDEAAAALPQYEVGSTYPCWYNPAAPNRAALTHAPYSLGLAVLYAILAFLGYYAMIGMALLFAVYLIFPTLYLLMRGQRTTGKIVAFVGSGRSRRARISYSIESRTYGLNAAIGGRIGKTITVLFDPRGVVKSVPRSSAYWVSFFVLPLMLFVLGAALFVAYWSWFLAL